MNKTLIPIIVAAFGLAASPALLAQGCCEAGAAMKKGCSMAQTAGAGGHEADGGMQAAGASNQDSTSRKVFMAPVQSVYDILHAVYYITCVLGNSWKFQVSNEARAAAWL